MGAYQRIHIQAFDLAQLNAQIPLLFGIKTSLSTGFARLVTVLYDVIDERNNHCLDRIKEAIVKHA